MFEKHFMTGKTVQTYQRSLVYAKSYTSRPHIPKVAVKFPKMACPEQI